MRSRRNKILLAALTLALSTRLFAAQPGLLINRLPTLDIPIAMLLNPCNDNHVTNVELNPLDDETYQILIHFDGVGIDKDKTYLACTLYSKLPADLSTTGAKFRLVSSKYQLNANMPAKAQANATFGVGMVPRGDRRFANENQLVLGKSETMNRLTAEVNQDNTGASGTRPDLSKILGNEAIIRAMTPSVRARLLAPRTVITPLVTTAATKNKFVFYNPALKAGLIKTLFPGIPLILKTIIVIINGSNTRGTAPDPTIGLEIPDSEKDAVITGDQYIANQFEFWFNSDEKDTGNAEVSVDWIEMIVKVQN